MKTKKFIIGSIIWTVLFLVIMTLVAFLLPKEQKMVIMIVEILLALFWTAINTIRIFVLIQKENLEEKITDNK